MMSATLALGLGACAAGETTDANVGTLDVQAEQASVSGTFAMGETVLDFSSAEVSAGEFDVVLDMHGMSLVALVDRDGQLAEIDGFADSGEDTQLLDADRVVLDAFVRALAAEIDTDEFGAGSVLYRVSSNWAQTPDTVPLQRQVAGSEERGWVSLCGYFGQYVQATHDGNKCSDFEAKCTANAQVGNRVEPTHSYLNGRWTTTVPDHVSNVVQTGSCYGNCGAGCPSGNQTLSLDCHDHDQCVRNGHALASFYCNDEFASASDDEFFAPRCSGT
ncbi:hypothetical protein [Haliangium ochraceum]|uniref:Putative lipoprotein n=1 Tax=Haliangium ochraceum (strain DSM 14365 / JCM 11303 / SMP-2) TaxID=502025 RepID=D0LY24_HALO1|nr:hypothetical protein [Haliangium ochraceum]ACY14379.1 putative lipoprotein [Haliangium ochraceum DSM 14365]